MPSPELAQSIILTIGSVCFGEWARRKGGVVAVCAALYLAFPAVGLGLQAAGLVSVVEPGKWISVLVTGAITGPLVWETVRMRSPLVQALVNVERDRRARWAREDAERAIRRQQEQERAAYYRGRVYAVAELIDRG